jgi:hypothetical protein
VSVYDCAKAEMEDENGHGYEHLLMVYLRVHVSESGYGRFGDLS